MSTVLTHCWQPTKIGRRKPFHSISSIINERNTKIFEELHSSLPVPCPLPSSQPLQASTSLAVPASQPPFEQDSQWISTGPKFTLKCFNCRKLATLPITV